MALIRPQQFYAAKLTRPLDLAGSETDVYVSTLPTETTGSVIIQPRSSTRREKITYTGTSSSGGSHLTGCTRGIAFATTTGSATSTARVAANCLRHAVGESVEMAPGHYESLMSDILGGTSAMANALNMGSNLINNLATPVSNTDAATKAYADGISTGGGPDANTTTKGFVEIATDAELQAGTGTGGTGAVVVGGGTSFTQIATANKVPVAQSNALLAPGWIALTTQGDMVFKGATELTRLAKGTEGTYLRAGASEPAWGGSNLDEANTFFGATDMTGAEAEMLTDNSTLTSKHFHKKTHGVINRDMTAASGAVTTAHGLGVTPKLIRLTAKVGTTNGTTNESYGIYNGSTTSTVYVANNSTLASASDTTNAVLIQTSAGNSQVAVATFDATNITLTWTKTGAPTATITIVWEAEV